MGFETLPNKLGNIPEQRPYIPPPPPVYDTSQSIKQLQMIGEYLSPEARAKRKAAVAKANYEYRMFQPGGKAERDATWMYQTRALDRRNRQLAIQLKEKALRGGYRDPDHAGAMEIFGTQPQEEVGPDELSATEDIE